MTGILLLLNPSVDDSSSTVNLQRLTMGETFTLPSNAEKYSDEELRTIKVRIRRAAKARAVALPDPDEFVELMARVRKRKK